MCNCYPIPGHIKQLNHWQGSAKVSITAPWFPCNLFYWNTVFDDPLLEKELFFLFFSDNSSVANSPKQETVPENSGGTDGAGAKSSLAEYNLQGNTIVHLECQLSAVF